MNEKLRNHVNILFAAAPSTDRAAEMKEELLANLDAKYDDLLREGYDTTTAFHIALSGIGDMDELFREFEKDSKRSLPPNPGNETLTAPVDFKDSPGPSKAPVFIALAIALGIALTILGPRLFVFSEPFQMERFGMSSMFLCWAIAAGLITFVLVKNSLKSDNSNGGVADQAEQNMQTMFSEDITNKRLIAGIFAILLGVFGVHKFYLGYTGAGLIMLLVSVCTVFVLSPVIAVIAFIEGVLYLAKSDRDFYNDYVLHRRSWF